MCAIFIAVIPLSFSPGLSCYGPVDVDVQRGAATLNLYLPMFFNLIERDQNITKILMWIDGVESSQWMPTIRWYDAAVFVKVPLHVLLLMSIVPTGLLWWRDRFTPPGCCPHCGYDLTGNVSGRCPECGTAIKHEGETA
jgi:hypothetical protein